MGTLDFVITSPPGGAWNSLPAADRTVTIRVPVNLDPYSQQELRDLLAGDFRRGAQAIIEQAQLGPLRGAASTPSSSNDRSASELSSLQDALAKLQFSLQQAADRWLATRAAAPPPGVPSLQGESLFIHAQQQLRQFEVWKVQIRSAITGQPDAKSVSVDREKCVQLANELQDALGKLAALLDGILEAPTNHGSADNSQESTIQELLTAIEDGHSLRSQLLALS